MNKHKNSILLCLALVFCLLLAGCAEQVELSTGKYNVEETTSFTGTVTKEDLALMDGLTMLESADFSGSSCVNEIFLWAQQHPNVDVRYTLQLPTGETVDNAVKNLDLSSLDSEALLGFVEGRDCVIKSCGIQCIEACHRRCRRNRRWRSVLPAERAR